MSNVDRAAKKQERIRRALQKIGNDPHGTLGVDEAGTVSMFMTAGSASGKTVAALSDLRSEAFFSTPGNAWLRRAAIGESRQADAFAAPANKYNDSAIRSRSWMGV